MLLKTKVLMISTCIVIISGCSAQQIKMEPVDDSFSVHKYNKKHIKKRISDNRSFKHSVAVGDFTLSPDGNIDGKSINCKTDTFSNSAIKYPEPIESYLKNILISKLRSSNLYAENPDNATTIIEGNIKAFALYDEIDILGEFKSLDLEIELHTNHGQSVRVHNIGSETLFWHNPGIEGCNQYAENVEQWTSKAFEQLFTKDGIKFLYSPTALTLQNHIDQKRKEEIESSVSIF